MLQRRDPTTPVPSSDPTERMANLPLPLRDICRECTFLYHIETMPAVLTTCPGPVQQISPTTSTDTYRVSRLAIRSLRPRSPALR